MIGYPTLHGTKIKYSQEVLRQYYTCTVSTKVTDHAIHDIL